MRSSRPHLPFCFIIRHHHFLTKENGQQLQIITMLLVSGRDDRWYVGGWTRQTAEDHHAIDERSRRPLVRRRLDAADRRGSPCYW